MRHSPPPISPSWLLPLALALGSCAGGPRPTPIPAASLKKAGFTAEYRLRWKGPGGEKRARLAAAFAPPTRLRLEILDGLGGSRAVLVTTEAGAILEDPVRREYRTYTRGSDALKALSGFELEPSLLAGLMAGNPGLVPGVRCAPAREGSCERECRNPGGERWIRILRSGKEWEMGIAGAAVLRARLEFSPGAPSAPPGRIVLSASPERGSADLKLREFRYGLPEEDLFSLAAPPSFRQAGPSPAPSRGEWLPP